MSYPLTIYPANATLEKVTINKCLDSSPGRTFLQNVSRFLVCLGSAYIALELAGKLDLVLALIGALFCAPLALIMPTLCHLVKVAKTSQEKLQDLAIIVLSVAV